MRRRLFPITKWQLESWSAVMMHNLGEQGFDFIHTYSGGGPIVLDGHKIQVGFEIDLFENESNAAMRALGWIFGNAPVLQRALFVGDCKLAIGIDYYLDVTVKDASDDRASVVVLQFGAGTS